MHNKYLLSTPLGLLIITVLVGVFLSSTSTSATSASTSLATVKVAASCTLTTTGGGNYSAIVPNGTSAEIAGSTMSVSCNDAGGFALYAVGYSDDTVGNNNMIGASTNIPTNTSGTNSYWAMKINPTSGTTPTIENSFNNYHIVPDIHTKIASYASSTGTGSLSVNATYKANISSTQLAGNYLGKVKYTLVHPVADYPNTFHIAQNVSAWKDELNVGDTIVMMDVRDNKLYTAAKLADGNIWMTQNLDFDIDSSKTYTSKDTDLPENTTWTPDFSTYDSDDHSWSWASDTPESYDPGEQYSLTYNDLIGIYLDGCVYDSCDDSIYNLLIEKYKSLADAQRYFLTCQSGTCDAEIYNQLTNEWKDFLATCDSSFESCDDSIFPFDENDPDLLKGPSQYRKGNYYNWTAAVAMNDTSGQAYSPESGVDLLSVSVDQSICPAGWTLPRPGTGEDSFGALLDVYGILYEYDADNSILQREPIFFIPGGMWSGSSSFYNVGLYWTPIADFWSSSFNFDFSDGYSEPTSSSPRDYGLSVRCIARPVSSSLENVTTHYPVE